MKAIALAALVALPALADTPDGGTDAPRAVVVLPADVAVADAKRIVGCEAERDELRREVMPLWVPVVVGVLALGAGVGIGYAVAARVTQHP